MQYINTIEPLYTCICKIFLKCIKNIIVAEYSIIFQSSCIIYLQYSNNQPLRHPLEVNKILERLKFRFIRVEYFELIVKGDLEQVDVT